MKVLILGIGSAQVDALRYCRDAGLEVHACGLAPEGAGRRLAQSFARIDIRDADAVEEYAREQGIGLVYSVGSDVAMPTAGAVSERLGLPRLVSGDTAATCQNKHRMRRALGPRFSGAIAHRLLETPADADTWTSFPCVVKPVDNQGQRGVGLVARREDFGRHYREARRNSPTGQVILEEYIDGPEVSANAYVRGGELVFLQVTDREILAGYPGGIPREHRIPSRHEDAGPAVRALVGEALRALAIAEGPAYFQLKIAESGPRLIEVTPRLDGCHLWRLIRESVGVDLLDATFRQLLGREPAPLQPREPAVRLTLGFFFEKPGNRFDRARYDIGSPRHLEWYYEQGETVRPVNGHIEKTGYLIKDGPGG